MLLLLLLRLATIAITSYIILLTFPFLPLSKKIPIPFAISQIYRNFSAYWSMARRASYPYMRYHPMATSLLPHPSRWIKRVGGQVHRPERVNQCTCPHGSYFQFSWRYMMRACWGPTVMEDACTEGIVKLDTAPCALDYSSIILNCRKDMYYYVACTLPWQCTDMFPYITKCNLDIPIWCLIT